MPMRPSFPFLSAPAPLSISSHMLTVLAAAQSQERADVRHVLQAFQEGYHIHQVAVRRVADPTLYRDGIVWKGSHDVSTWQEREEKETC